jgi:hypothetical protein
MADKPANDELRSRILRDTEHYGGKLPEKAAIAWSAYLAALIEWGLISPSQHQALCELLPKIEDDPALGILLGRPDPR